MEICSEDKGHRYGNYHNYYSFHPSEERIQFLDQEGFFHVIVQKLKSDADERHSGARQQTKGNKESVSMVETDETSNASNSAGENGGKKRRREDDPTTNDSETHAGTLQIRYCDLGCNEGDLTRSMVDRLQRLLGQTFKTQKIELHALGLDLDPVLIQRAVEKTSLMLHATFQTCNLCQEENFRHVCRSFLQSLARDSSVATETAAAATTITTTGEITPASQVTPEESDDHSIAKRARTVEPTRNGSTPSTLAEAVAPTAVTTKNENETGSIEENSNSKRNKEDVALIPKARQFHFVTIFSTTMWIHLQGGDEGLRKFLLRACEFTSRLLLIEPQPSKCYRLVNVRLRKMKRPEVRQENLELRLHIEDEIHRIVESCGFRRVTISKGESALGLAEDQRSTGGSKGSDQAENQPETFADISGRDTNDGTSTNRTKWNRTLLLYERIRPDM